MTDLAHKLAPVCILHPTETAFDKILFCIPTPAKDDQRGFIAFCWEALRAERPDVMQGLEAKLAHDLALKRQAVARQRANERAAVRPSP